VTALLLGLSLYAVTAVLMLWTVRRDRDTFLDASADGIEEFGRLLPQLAVGFIGSGFLAAALPQELVTARIGPESGALGLFIAAAAGAVTPGGPVVGFAIGAAALKAGAGIPQVVTFVSAWSLFGLTRIIVWELPTMPRNVFLMRMLVTLPLPVIAALLAAALAG
jgi:uncharacterized membrane protein YraQ (UPF0718 family)